MRFSFLFLFATLMFGSISSSWGDLTVTQVIEERNDEELLDKEVMTIFVKGNAVRIDQGQALSSIIRNDRKLTYSIMHSPKKYVVLKHGKLDESDESHEAEDFEGLEVESTGKTEEISGYATHQVLVKERNGDATELWISEGALDMNLFLKEFKSFIQFGFVQSASLLEKHPELKGVPIRIIETQGKINRKGTITRLDTSILPDSLFEVPAGYAEIKNAEEFDP